MGAYATVSTPAVRGQSHVAPAICDSLTLWFSDPCLDDEGEPALQKPGLCTLEDLAAELGISREQVGVIEQRALRKCRAYCEARGLHLDDLLAAQPLGGRP